MKIKINKLKEDLKMPTRAHYDDAGIDCYAQEDIVLPAMTTSSYIRLNNFSSAIDNCEVAYLYDDHRDIIYGGSIDLPFEPIESPVCQKNISLYVDTFPRMIGLGFALEVPNGYMATIRPRSSMNAKGVLTQIGTIDSGYRGEIKAVLINLTGEDIEIKKGDKICQIIIQPVTIADFVENLGDKRGIGGFGSTGR